MKKLNLTVLDLEGPLSLELLKLVNAYNEVNELQDELTNRRESIANNSPWYRSFVEETYKNWLQEKIDELRRRFEEPTTSRPANSFKLDSKAIS